MSEYKSIIKEYLTELLLIDNFVNDTKHTSINSSEFLYGENYSNSWKYLMLAVNKIEQNVLIEVRIQKGKCIIADVDVLNGCISKHKSYYDEVVEDNKLYSVYKAVYNYIKYNEGYAN